jgi:hypothetical protein
MTPDRGAASLRSILVTSILATMLGRGCGGQELAPDATCESACAYVDSCFTEVGVGCTCQTFCEMQQVSCSGEAGSAAFQGLLNCIAPLTCETPKMFPDPGATRCSLWRVAELNPPEGAQAACASWLDQVKSQCPLPP